MKVSLCLNLKNPKICGEDTIEGVLQKIKNGQTQQLVLLARMHGKETPMYEQIKALIETFTPNGRFKNIRAIDNLVNFSGYIYIDVDDNTDKEMFIKTEFIHACWFSLSGKGMGALAKVTDLNVNNFKASWQYLKEYFKKNYGVTIDKKTSDISRQNVISFDPNIYINNNCSSLDANQLFNIFTSSITTNKNTIYTTTFSSNQVSSYFSNISNLPFLGENNQIDSIKKIIYRTTLSETEYMGQPYVVIEEGRPYRGAFLPKRIEIGKRHSWLSVYITSILFNNQYISLETLENLIHKANKYHCNPPLETKEIVSLTNWFYKKFINNELQIDYTLKKIWINKAFPLSTSEKKSIIGKESAKLRKKKTINNIQIAYDELKLSNNNVTQVMVRDFLNDKQQSLRFGKKTKGISIRTIKKYWKEIVK